MKKCSGCKGIYQDKYVMCPNCNIPLLQMVEDNQNIKTTPIGTTKEEFQHRISNKEKIQPTEVVCPLCGSKQVQIMKRGWKLTTGFLGAGKNVRVCKNCLHKW